MQIFASVPRYSRLRCTDSRMDVEEKPEYPKISGGLQIMIALEVIPYFTTVVLTSVLVSYALDHTELEFSDVFAWRGASFTGFTFMILSLANYGDRVMNGRFYLFLMFLVYSIICTPAILVTEQDIALIVFCCCLQPLWIVRDASRLCYIVQILRASERCSKIRTLCFFLFLMTNIGAFFGVAILSVATANPLGKIISCLVCLTLYILLASLVNLFGTNIVAHRNIVERGFKCAVWKFENVVKAITQNVCGKLCGCYTHLKRKDYGGLYDKEIITSVNCVLKMSATLVPLIIYFASIEITFYIWVRDYDVFVDLGFQDWPITLADVYHGFNVVCVLVFYVIIIPIVQCFVNVPDLVIVCLSYFVLCLSWVTAASLQYSNELRQTHYSIENESKVLVFSNILDPVLLDAYWSDKKWLDSGNFTVNYFRPNVSSNDTLYLNNGLIWVDKTPKPTLLNPNPPKNLQLGKNATFLIHLNRTECFLLTQEGISLAAVTLRGKLNGAFDVKTSGRDQLNGTLFILCSENLWPTLKTSTEYILVIQNLRSKELFTQEVCDPYFALANLKVGWYILFLRANGQYVPFQMKVNIRKGAVHYLYIQKVNETFAPYTGIFTNIVEPFFQIEQVYILVQLALFSLAFSMGMVALHSFVAGATPKHLLEFGFAIMYTSWALGGGVSAIMLPYVTPTARGMLYWVLSLVSGLLLLVRNAWAFLATGGQCGPDVKLAGDEEEEDSSESETEDDGSHQDTLEPVEEPEQKQDETPTETVTPVKKPKSWFSRSQNSQPVKGPSPRSSPRKDIPVKNSAPVTSKRTPVQPEPSEKLETLSSWFARKPNPPPEPAPSLEEQLVIPSEDNSDARNDTSKKIKTKNRKK